MRRWWQEADCDGAPESVAEVNGYSTDRVIDADNVITEPYTEAYQKSGYNTYEESTHGIHGVTAGSDADQTGQGSIQTHGNIRFAIFDPGEDHTGNGCDSRCNGGGSKDGSQLRAIGCGSTVESVPAKPENEASKSTDDNVMSGIAFGVPSLLYLPRRGPSIQAPISALKPPTIWMAQEPANHGSPSVPASRRPRSSVLQSDKQRQK